MESRARFVLVGLFLLLSAAGLFLFMRWVSPDEEDIVIRRTAQFEGSVSGLAVGSEVRYLGVPVGRVLDIGLNAQRAGRVDVQIGLDQLPPAPGGLVALLEPQGITGLALIELRDREDATATIDVAPGLIPGQPSLFSAVSASATRVADKTDAALTRINALLTEQTVADLAATARELRVLTANLAGASAEVGALVAALTRAGEQLESALPAYTALAVRVEGELLPVLADTGRALQAASGSLAAILGENREDVRQLLEQDLPSLSRLGDEVALTLEELRRLIENINNQPGALLYGRSVVEVEIPDGQP